MPALLAADAAAVLLHILIHIFVAHGGLGVVDAQLVKGLVQAKVGHDGGDHRVGDQLAPLLHIAAVDIQDVVAGDHVALLVHAQAPVGVTVVGKAHIQTLLDDEFLQALDVGGAGVFVDVQAVGLGVDDVGGGAQRVKHRLGDVPAGAVGAVQADLHAPEAVHAKRDQVADIPVAAGDIIHRAADLVLAGKGQLRPFLAEHLQLAVQVSFHEGDGLLVHLLALAVDQLDAVVIVGVVGCRDHDAAVKAVHPRDVGHAGGGGDVQKIRVRAGSHQAAHQAVLEHIGRAPGVLADDDAGRAFLAGQALLRRAAAFFIIIPAQEPAYLVCVVGGQGDIGFPAEAVGAKIFTHTFISKKSLFVGTRRSKGAASIASCGGARGEKPAAKRASCPPACTAAVPPGSHCRKAWQSQRLPLRTPPGRDAGAQFYLLYRTNRRCTRCRLPFFCHCMRRRGKTCRAPRAPRPVWRRLKFF